MNPSILKFANIYITFSLYIPLAHPKLQKILKNLSESQVSDLDNNFLCVILDETKILTILKQAPSHKSLGLNGMMGQFYKHYWVITKKEVVAAIQNFFISGKLQKQIHHTHIVLIPKIPNPSTLRHYHPISLNNIVYKIISKILANRLKTFLPRIISPLQTTFILGRFIQENSIIAHELFHILKKKVDRMGIMAIKLEMIRYFNLN